MPQPVQSSTLKLALALPEAVLLEHDLRRIDHNHAGVAVDHDPVVLSNQATPRILREYRRLGFELKTFEAPRKISCTGDRSPATEVLAIRNLSL